ncbi:MAG: prenyltransferase/squalene oxidase repeat-containing protein [Anaerolineales bacterium]
MFRFRFLHTGAARLWGPRLLLVFVCLALVNSALAQPADLDAAQNWLLAAQAENGGWSDGLSERSGPGITVESVLALRALGADPAQVAPEAGDFLRRYTNQNITTFTPGLAAQMALGALALGADPRDFSSVDLLARAATLDDETGLYGGTVYDHCQVVLAWRAAGEAPPDEALMRIPEAAHPDGGWGFAPESPRDTATTALCLQALHNLPGIDRTPGLDYLRAAQNPDGGWPFQRPSPFTTGSDAYSTAQVIMTLNTLGADLADWNNPQTTLAAFQAPDGGFDYLGSELPAARVWATTSAIRALSGAPVFDLSS